MPIIFAGATEHRPSFTEKVVGVTKQFVENYGITTQIIDGRKELEFCHANREIATPEAKQLSATLKKSDGFIIVSPEYNHGYPGDLKNLLDSFYDEYNRKPVAIIGVSDGGIGGARMVEQLRLVAIALQMVPINGVIHFSQVDTLFDDNDVLLKKELYEKRFTKLLEELSWYALALKSAREKK